jgi:hypothetical protein
MHLAVLSGLLAALLLLAMLATLLFRRVWRRKSPWRDAAINAALLLHTALFLGLALEFYFYRFAIVPEGFAITLASQRWLELHYAWNSKGFRDREHAPEDFAGKRALFVVGDSFAAGSGVPNQTDRFSDQLATRLGNDWRIANLAIGGWDTTDELEALRNYPIKPDIVLMSYYLNDIQHAVENQGHEFVPPLPQPPALLRPLIDNSYFANTVYWRAFRAKAQFVKDSYWDNLKRYYADASVWGEHAQALRDFAAYCRESNIELYVLIFPNLSAVEDSKPITEKVASLFDGLGVATLDLTPVLAGRPAQELVVNAVNAHPNEAVHHEVAALLESFLRAHSALLGPAETR